MHAFVISYVRTVLRVLSKYSLACWFGQMLTKAISWMKSSIASPTPRGIPVSLVRPWIWSLYYIRFRNSNKFIEPHLDVRWNDILRVLYFPSHCAFPPPTYPWVSSMSPHHCVLSAIMYDYWRACNNLVERPQFNPVIYFMLLAYCIKKLSTSKEDFSHTGLKRLVYQ